MRFSSYWLDTCEPFAGRSRELPGGSCDVLVVGAGITGSAAALALARKGASVVVCEAGTVGQAASGRNGGMCNNGFAQDYASLSRRLGTELANRLYLAFDAGVDMVERLIREESIDCDFARFGKLKLAAKPEHYDRLVRSQALLAAGVDPDTRVVSKAELRDEIGSDRYHGGLLLSKSAGMHVGRYVRGLANAAQARGAHVLEHTPVLGLARQAGGAYVARTPLGAIRARQVLLASGISQIGPFGWIRRRIVPVGAFIIVTEPLPRAVLDRLLPTRRMVTDTRNFVNFFRETPDGRLLFGGRARFAASDPRSDEKSGRILQRQMVAVFPELATARIDYCWGGMVDMTANRLPRAGERDGMYYSMGYSGHGTHMATLMGTLMAEIMDGRADLNPWSSFDWPAIPGHFGKPWFLPMVGAWYRIKDFLQ
ncbi:NAD(P)/FAD-dependent oxidoreductase [Burkholderia gladioli]|jgi:glycine/D-amino acid oxidase-like deaminating enzyme|uniref:FAD dependent oxidoreductase family protein n=1 Tax=Burkholderia gladioli TaxID=28095 RepID=A0AAP8S7A5_BURGA|nr:FAD-binding oxidoreductase [Burkholderia gladioli]AJW95706.1 FAD dependent oxidoreductase family protein [Burkholderia gladioli]ASD82732.1 FAD-binding oxidoreductase [Burkholderia gladioli pv. gladioli]AWY50170.1 FAD-binding oxidoreductase [Burkholderia gladioli pv. gladioli]KAF1059791.1 Gamma-glutamylputrescine oxidoreductase [Burkholderia gladioli]KGC14248.1 FAD dependent oxidoreductase family protein [Burkholderia gladioli]